MSIDSIQATIPCTGIQYCDLRPTISASSIEEYREQLAEVGRLAGNDAFVNRMTQTKAGKEKIVTPGGTLYFDSAAHTYEDEQGNSFLTGSTFAAQFEEPFKADLIAKKVAERKLTTVEKVLESWDMKGEIARDYGTTVHKALECGIKYNELPSNPHLATLIQDYLDLTRDDEQVSEQFVADFEDHLCGTIDVLVNKGNKHVVIRDFKTNTDVFKKITLTQKAKELWGLEAKTISIYQLQLSFYAHILKKQGYKVDGLEIWYIEAEAWKVAKLQPLDVKEAL